MRFTKTDSGYKFDKRLFQFLIIAWVILFGAIAYKENLGLDYNFYIECTEDVCKNPLVFEEVSNPLTAKFIENCDQDFCKEPYLNRGVYGTKPPRALKLLPWFVALTVILTLNLNHLLYNKGRAFEMTLNVPDKWKNKGGKNGDNNNRLND